MKDIWARIRVQYVRIKESSPWYREGLETGTKRERRRLYSVQQRNLARAREQGALALEESWALSEELKLEKEKVEALQGELRTKNYLLMEVEAVLDGNGKVEEVVA